MKDDGGAEAGMKVDLSLGQMKKTSEKDEGIQINKYISSSGFCSRREADKLIEQLRVTINGELVLPTARVMEGDVVAIDGERIKNKQRPI